MARLTDFLLKLVDHTASGIRFGSATADKVVYAELLGRAIRQAGHFLPGQRVLVVGNNSQAQVEALLACWWAGAVPICLPTPMRLSPGQVYRDSLRRWQATTGATRGLADADLLERCQELTLADGWQPLPLPLGEPVEPGREGDLAYIQFSSGTTREPRAVPLTHANLCHNLSAFLALILQRDDSCVSWLPLYHDMGLIGGLLSALAAPGDLVLLRPFQFAARPQGWLEALAESRATMTPAPNFALTQVLDRVPADLELDLSHLRLLLLGSETVRPEDLRRFYDRFRANGLRWEALTPVYGLAEATLAVTFSPPGRGPRLVTRDGRELVSVGRPLPGVEVRVDDEGQVLTRSPSVMAGYLGGSPAGEWLNTGDLGFLEDGELFLTGRSKDVLIVRGRNLDPAGFEEALRLVEGLDPGRAAAVGLTDNGTESVLVLAERRRKESLPVEEQRRQAVSAIARETGMAARVHLVEAGWLPRTTSGKVRRGAARERYLAELA